MGERAPSFRGFVAVTLPDPVRERVAALIESLRGDEVRWTAPRNLHLTLKFLGQVPTERLAALVEGLADAASAPPFECELAGVGAFPKTEQPRVIWVGVSRGHDALAELAARIDMAAHRVGFEREERPFRAHLTLGRTRQDVGPAGHRRLAERIRGAEAGPFGTVSVDAVHLVESTLTPNGPIYSLKERFTLGGSLG